MAELWHPQYSGSIFFPWTDISSESPSPGAHVWSQINNLQTTITNHINPLQQTDQALLSNTLLHQEANAHVPYDCDDKLLRHFIIMSLSFFILVIVVIVIILKH